MRSISGFGELLLAEATTLSPRSKEFIRRSHAAVQRMDQLITDALNYNKVVRQEFVTVPIDCEALLREIIRSYPQFHEARHCISINDPIPKVQGNVALLTQCFSNLLLRHEVNGIEN